VTRPEPRALALHPIRFGTSGWRGVLGDEVTLPRLRALAAAVAAWLAESQPRARVLVAHDTRFLGAELAGSAARVLGAAGLRPLAIASPVPTPVVAHAVRRRHGDAALVVTASHNAPEYQGVKVIAAWGGGVTDEQARRIESLCGPACSQAPRSSEAAGDAVASAATRSPGVSRKRSRSERAQRGEAERSQQTHHGSAISLFDPALDLVPAYLGALREHVDRDAFRGTRLSVIYDALHGTGAGVCDRALRGLGARVEVLHGERTPRFGGGAPDPVPARLGGLARRVRSAAGLCIGLATDGDGDRYAVIDAGGRPLAESEAVALLVDQLARTGRVRRGVALSTATGSLPERVAGAHGLRVVRHPIGFKHLSRALWEGSADVAGEESGGFAWDPLARDKDGILACALLAELAAATRAPLRARLAELERRHGRSRCGRVAGPVSASSRARLARWIEAPPTRVDAARVLAVDTRDGLRLAFDDGFLMLRASGTEPVLRIYAEAPDRRALERRLAAGRRLLDANRRAR